MNTFFKTLNYKKLIIFAAKVIALYLLWLIIGTFLDGVEWISNLKLLVLEGFTKNLIYANKILSALFLGVDLTSTFTDKVINGDVYSSGLVSYHNIPIISIGKGCTGHELIFYFMGLVFILPGSIKVKLWYIPLGALIIHLGNIFRIFGLTAIILNFPNHISFYHDYVFKLILYSITFILWAIWINKYTRKEILEK